jgi:hypothetical protein
LSNPENGTHKISEKVCAAGAADAAASPPPLVLPKEKGSSLKSQLILSHLWYKIDFLTHQFFYNFFKFSSFQESFF